MYDTVMQFFDTLGLSAQAPETFPELATWFVTFFAGLMLVLAVFRLAGYVISGLMSFRGWGGC